MLIFFILGNKGVKDKQEKLSFDFKNFYIIIINLHGSCCYYLSYTKNFFFLKLIFETNVLKDEF